MTPKSSRPNPTLASDGLGEPPLPQIGRTPSNPYALLIIAIAWIACGVVALVGLTATWRLVPGIVFIGVGLLFLRGGVVALARRDR